MTTEVVVTGLGAVTPLATTADASWEAVLAGKSGADRIDRFDPAATDIRSKIACTSEFEPTDHGGVDHRRMGRYAQFAVVAAERAVADADLEITSDDASESDTRPDAGADSVGPRGGTSIGTGFAGLGEIEAAVGERPSPYFVPSMLANLAAGHVSIRFDARGPTLAPAAACAAGTQAIGTAADAIRAGRADVMLAGGAEAPISPLGVGGFDAMRALSTRNDEPAAASRPFDADRDGFVLGEGAGVVVLESSDHARDRGATPLAAVSGYGVTADAVHVTRPPADAHGMIRCLEVTLDSAGIPPETVDYVNPHGTGTPRGDAHEATALQAVFEECPPVSSTKSHIGHTLGAAGAIESVFTVRALRADTIPPTINYETPDPACDLPIVADARGTDVEVALTSSAGFGGVNAALVLESI